MGYILYDQSKDKLQQPRGFPGAAHRKQQGLDAMHLLCQTVNFNQEQRTLFVIRLSVCGNICVEGYLVIPSGSHLF